MIAGIISLAGLLVGLLAWWIKRRAARKDDPKEQVHERYEQIDQDIAKGDSMALTLHADNDLDTFERLQNDRESHQR